MNRLLRSEAPILAKVRNNKSKRVLQVLQVSATDKDLLVSPNSMSGKGKKPAPSQKKSQVVHDALLSKENTPVVPTVRRSKRKNAVAEDQGKKASSKEGTETNTSSNKVCKATKSKKASTKKSKKQNSSDLKQSKMDSFIASTSTSNTIFESNLENVGSYKDNNVLVQQAENSIEAVVSPIKAPSNLLLQHSKTSVEAAVSPIKVFSSDPSLQNSKDSGLGISLDMLTSDNPSEGYWKILAEERRVALEEALLENEQLYDQLQVLETENSQLKSCLQEAENVAVVLRQALE